MQAKDNVALITGAGSGLASEATAKCLAEEGASVAATDINGEKTARVTSEITADSGSALAVVKCKPC